MARPEFVHLHVHSQYSMLDGAIRVKDLVNRVSAGGMAAVALTDHGNMFGAIALYKAAKEAGVQAILGCEIDVLADGRPKHLPLLAASVEGYKNLVHLVSMGHVAPPSDAPPGHACISLETLAGKTKGLVGMTGCMGGLVAQSVLEQGVEAGRRMLERLVEVFDREHLYVELQDHGLPEQPVLNRILVDLARDLDLPLVATNDVHYAERRDAQAQMLLGCIKTGRTMDEARERHHGSEEMYLKTPFEMAQVFGELPQSLTNTLRIAEMCKLKLKLGEAMLPTFPIPEGYDVESYFRHVAREGLVRRFAELDAQGKIYDRAKYENRLEMELGVICQMKFPGYFLIVWDFIRYAKENGVPVGPGRGSGAGSIVAWSMRITDLDPIPYNLLFERFLNPERISMPDFDIDFCMDRRDFVIAYVQKKYGEPSVGQIATFAELKAKSVVKDVGRAMGITAQEAQQIANLIPRKTPAETYTIQESLTVEPKLKQRYDQEPRIKELLELGSRIEGMTRHAGKHAAGIVISEGPLWEHVPVFRDDKSGALVTQYYKDDVEAAGLVKFDFLGLKTLTVLDIAVRLINARPDVKAKLELAAIPLTDLATFSLLGSGETKGVFQLESTGMQQLFKDLRADTFEDIIAAVALYRPGPIGSGMVGDFVTRKHGRQAIGRMHPLVDHLLEPTYGVIVYQEQVMQIAQALAGYTLGSADLLRRAMGKKKPEEMAKQKDAFLDGAKNKGVDEKDAERIFGLLEYFAGYGFNKCIVGSTSLIEAETGEQTTVRELFNHRRPFFIHALGEHGKLEKRRVVDVMSNGRQPVFTVRTAQGRRITATGNHPFRTFDGWTNLEDLRPGDFVAAPRRLPTAATVTWPEHEIIALAGLLAEGNTCHPTCLYFFGNDAALVNDFAQAASRFSNTVARVYPRDESRLEVCVSTGRDMRFFKGMTPWNAAVAPRVETVPVRSGMFEWARNLDLLGRKAPAKRIPEPVFLLRDPDLELFLGRLWAGDGFIANATQAVPFYATSSEQLAEGVQTLLLRLGIQSGVHRKTFRYRGGERTGFTVHVLGERSAELFLERVAVHCVGRERAVELLRRHLLSTERGRTSKDTIPAKVATLVDAERRKAHLTWSQLEEASRVSMKMFQGRSVGKIGFRRTTILKLAEYFSSRKLREIATSDVFWDRVVAIEPAGVEETYDLTVEIDHNFVANGLIVHNSHSAAYALLTYQTAYLKAHYPVETLCAIMTSDKDKIEKVVRTIADARAMGATVLPPDINESDTDFKVVYAGKPLGKRKLREGQQVAPSADPCGPQIRFGLGAVRGVGGAALEALFEARSEGPFRDLFDFAARVDAKRVNKAVFESLVACGAFDTTLADITRARAYASVDVALERSRAASRDRDSGQTSMFSLFDAASVKSGAPVSSQGTYNECPPWDSRELLARERTALGFYVSGHPLDRYLRGGGALARLEAKPISEMPQQNDWAVVKLVGVVEGYRERIFKDGGGGKIAFFELEDLTSRVTVKVRGSAIDTYAPVLTSGEPVLVTGKVSFPRRDDDAPEDEMEAPREPTILLNEARLLSEVVREDAKQLVLKLSADQVDDKKLSRVRDLFTSSRGDCPVVIQLSLGGGREAVLGLGRDYRVDVGDDLFAGLERLFGAQVAELR